MTFPKGTLNSKYLYYSSSGLFLCSLAMLGLQVIARYLFLEDIQRGDSTLHFTFQSNTSIDVLMILLGVCAFPLGGIIIDKVKLFKGMALLLTTTIFSFLLFILYFSSRFLLIAPTLGLAIYSLLTLGIILQLNKIYHPQDLDRTFLLFFLFATGGPTLAQQLFPLIYNFLGPILSLGIAFLTNLAALVFLLLAKRHLPTSQSNLEAAAEHPADLKMLKSKPWASLIILFLFIALTYLSTLLLQGHLASFAFFTPFNQQIAPPTSFFKTGLEFSDFTTLVMLGVVFYWQKMAKKQKEIMTVNKLLNGVIFLIVANFLILMLQKQNNQIVDIYKIIAILSLILLSLAQAYLIPVLITFLSILSPHRYVGTVTGLGFLIFLVALQAGTSLVPQASNFLPVIVLFPALIFTLGIIFLFKRFKKRLS
ncbi:MAG: MFS transporter [Pseudomonadota bacterium]